MTRTSALLIAAALLMTVRIPDAGAAQNGNQRDEAISPSVTYVTLDAPPGTSQAVIVEGNALAYTRQLLPVDHSGQLVGLGSVEDQIDQTLDNLEKVLEAADSDLSRLVRVNVYALEPSTTELVRQRLSKRLSPSVRPALTAVLTPLPHRDALVALDAVAVANSAGQDIVMRRSRAVSEVGCADAAILPAGGVAYISGVPAEGGLTESAVDASMTGLADMLGKLNLSFEHVVHIKVFLRPASSAGRVLEELREYFPNQLLPPVVFVEWLAPPPVEIELIAQLPASDSSAPGVEYYDPPEVSPMQIFSRAALVRSPRQIFVAGLFAEKPSGAQDQALNVFDQLQSILAETGSDLRHLAKGTYYVCDDGSARGMDRARLWLYDQDRPPAASKCMVHGMGQPGRTLTLDMIAVPADDGPQ